jgi:hypothetical protein
VGQAEVVFVSVLHDLHGALACCERTMRLL